MHRTLLIASALLMGVLGVPVSQDPVQPQCKVIWLIGAPCTDVFMTVVNQIKAWTGTTSCELGGENCMYELESVTPLVVKATKTSPSTMNMSNLTLTMSPIEDPSICRVTGDAISESWTSPLDNGMNYCSLEDLIIGSGLNNTLGFKEFTSNWICLGYTLGSCTVTSLNKKI